MLFLTPRDPTDLERVRQRTEAVLGTRATTSPELGRVSAPLDNADVVTDLLVDLRSTDVRLVELSVRRPTLDEVFLTITGHEAEPARPSSEQHPDRQENAS